MGSKKKYNKKAREDSNIAFHKIDNNLQGTKNVRITFVKI